VVASVTGGMAILLATLHAKYSSLYLDGNLGTTTGIITGTKEWGEVTTLVYKRGGDHPDVKYMVLAGKSIVGGQFVDDDFADESIFLNFAVQQACFWDQSLAVSTPLSSGGGGDGNDGGKSSRRVLQLGLGVGTAVNFLRKEGVPVDVVELNPEVVAVASLDFRYTPEEGAWGSTHIEDAFVHIMGRQTEVHDQQHTQKYAIVIHDVFVGYNPWPLLSKEVLAALRSKWMAHGGKLLLNFVGYHRTADDGTHQSAHLLTATVLRTLQSEFGSVRCFREIPPDMLPDNMVSTA
jgi:hypothetical protein